MDGDGNVVEPGNVGGYPELSAKCIHLGIRKIRPNAKVILKIQLNMKDLNIQNFLVRAVPTKSTKSATTDKVKG